MADPKKKEPEDIRPDLVDDGKKRLDSAERLFSEAMKAVSQILANCGVRVESIQASAIVTARTPEGDRLIEMRPLVLFLGAHPELLEPKAAMAASLNIDLCCEILDKFFGPEKGAKAKAIFRRGTLSKTSGYVGQEMKTEAMTLSMEDDKGKVQ